MKVIYVYTKKGINWKVKVYLPILTTFHSVSLFISLLIFFNWRITALQCCVSFCCMTKRINYVYTYTAACLNLPPSESIMCIHIQPPAWTSLHPNQLCVYIYSLLLEPPSIWINYVYTYTATCLCMHGTSLHPSPLGHHRTCGGALCAVQYVPCLSLNYC